MFKIRKTSLNSTFYLFSKYYDSKSTKENPRWFMVDVKPIERLENIVTLQDVKEKPELSSMALIKPTLKAELEPKPDLAGKSPS